jgi:hypothetical protein
MMLKSLKYGSKIPQVEFYHLKLNRLRRGLLISPTSTRTSEAPRVLMSTILARITKRVDRDARFSLFCPESLARRLR